MVVEAHPRQAVALQDAPEGMGDRAADQGPPVHREDEPGVLPGRAREQPLLQPGRPMLAQHLNREGRQEHLPAAALGLGALRSQRVPVSAAEPA